ncbi:MAG: hypothetical protein CM1200mP34_0150 [Verrucomicrobiales bacterium]|nr:MAG: hypothetical protein CM1200mP34_0150 [Verrucomicrobiales bacterium]
MRLAVASGGAHLAPVRVRLAKALGQAPGPICNCLRPGAAQTQTGAKALLGLIESGLAPAGLLLDPQIKGNFPESRAGRVAALTPTCPSRMPTENG